MLRLPTDGLSVTIFCCVITLVCSYPVSAESGLSGCVKSSSYYSDNGYRMSRRGKGWRFPKEISPDDLSIDNCSQYKEQRFYAHRGEILKYCSENLIMAEWIDPNDQIVFSCNYKATPSPKKKPYRWKDEAGNAHFSENPPPISCQSDDCLALRVSETYEPTQEAKEKLDSLEEQIREYYQSLEAQLEAEERKRIEKKREMEVLRKKRETHLPANEAFCFRLSDMENYLNSGHQYRDFLIENERCFRVYVELKYVIRGEKIGNLAPILVSVGDLKAEVWTHYNWIPYFNKDRYR